MMTKIEVAVQLMLHLVTHWWHGYSMVSRWGDGEGVCEILVGGRTYEVEQGDRDCSAAVVDAYQSAGISCGGATYTGNMRRCMVASGNFVWHPRGDGYRAKPGDTYLREGHHTAMCLDDGRLMEFSISETGGIDGKEGDQTGWESHVRAYYDYPWDGILECINTDVAPGSTSQASPAPAPTSDKIDVDYAVMLEGGAILPMVHNRETEDGYAGVIGRKIVGLACKVSAGSIKYRVHLEGGGWLPFVTGYDWRDYKNGWAGTGKKPIDCVEAYLYSPRGDKYIFYRVSTVGNDYFPAQRDNEINPCMDGYAGRYDWPIDRIQMWVE